MENKTELVEWIMENVVAQFRVVYRPPETVKTEADMAIWFTVFCQAIATASIEKPIIWQAWLNVAKSYRGSTWPAPGVICEQIEKVQSSRHADRDQKTLPAAKKKAERSDYEIERIMREICATLDGRQILVDGSGFDLWLDIKEMRVDGVDDVTNQYLEKLAAGRRKFGVGMIDAETMAQREPHGLGPSLVSLGHRMVKRSEWIREHYLQ